jgi:hypothetical protein
MTVATMTRKRKARPVERRTDYQKDHVPAKPVSPAIEKLCVELQLQQRQWAIVVKSRIKQENRLRALVAGTLGYSSGLSDKEREKFYKLADAKIKDVVKNNGDSPLKEIILVTRIGIDAFLRMQDTIEEVRLEMVKQLPVADWAVQKDQRGFGLQSLATVVGEAGNLSNYSAPPKLWRRLGCAPHTYNGHTLMGATWRSGKRGGSLPKEEWVKFGYSPRRRSLAYVIGENLMKQNFLTDKATKKTTWCGPYRLRYLEARERFDALHPECQEDGEKKRSQLHGQLLATKLLLKNLWIQWQR